MATTTHSIENNHFKHALNFGDSDLEMNRRGHISETQRTRLEKESKSSLQQARGCGAICVGLGLVVMLIANVGNQFLSSYLGAIMLGLLGTGLIAVFMAIRIQSGTREDLALNRVEATTGLVKRHTEQVKDGLRYYITINDKSYGVPQTAYNLFKDDVQYRFYHTAHDFTLMSVEEIGPDIPA